MAVSTISFDFNKNLIGSSTTSFQTVLSGYGGRALDNLRNNIANYSSGVISMSSSGGPDFSIVLGKYNNDYYAGLLFSYASNAVYYFRAYSGTYYIYRAC